MTMNKEESEAIVMKRKNPIARVGDSVESLVMSRSFGKISKVDRKHGTAVVKWHDKESPEVSIERINDLALVQRKKKKLKEVL